MTRQKPLKLGHADHTKDAFKRASTDKVERRIKLTFLGAGSFFTPRLINDVLRIPGLRGGTVALVDIDPARLALSKRLIQKLVREHAPANTQWKIVASTERREVLAGSDYVISCIEVNGLECVHFDNDIPLKYGVDQCIGDTIGPGGLFKALRTIPVWVQVLQDCEKLCPKALVLNYTNPMGMMCLAAARSSSMNVLGLCHSVQGTSTLLASLAGVRYDELQWECAGINHLAWFTKLAHHGRDLYPDLKRRFREDLALGLQEYDRGLALSDSTDRNRPGAPAIAYTQDELVRKDMCLQFGAFITESSGHLSEYLPYYRKSAAGRKLLRLNDHGGSRFYATNWPYWRTQQDRQRREMLLGKLSMKWERSWEYASWIIEAAEKNLPHVIHGNVHNSRQGGGTLISNLPADGCVEVACLIDGNGVHPTRFGQLPSQMAALCASNMVVFGLGVEAALEHSVEKAAHALMLDPLCAAVCTPGEIRAMTLEMFAAEKDFLPGYA